MAIPEAPFTITRDAFLGGRLELYQPAQGYRAAIDPVVLAASIPVSSGDSVLDVGCGVGTALLALMTRVAGLSGAGLDVQSDMVELARQNAALNDLADLTEFIEADLATAKTPLGDRQFDHVISNPPFFDPGKAQTSPNASKALANVESSLTLAGWIDFCSKRTRSGGSLSLILPTERLDEVLAALIGRLGAVVVMPLWQRAPVETSGNLAKRVLVQGWKGRKTPLRLLAGQGLHDTNGNYTPWAEGILRACAPINL